MAISISHNETVSLSSATSSSVFHLVGHHLSSLQWHQRSGQNMQLQPVGKGPVCYSVVLLEHGEQGGFCGGGVKRSKK